MPSGTSDSLITRAPRVNAMSQAHRLWGAARMPTCSRQACDFSRVCSSVSAHSLRKNTKPKASSSSSVMLAVAPEPFTNSFGQARKLWRKGTNCSTSAMRSESAETSQEKQKNGMASGEKYVRTGKVEAVASGAKGKLTEKSLLVNREFKLQTLGLDSLEKTARQSIEQLRHILYRVKSRAKRGEHDADSMAAQAGSAAEEPAVTRSSSMEEAGSRLHVVEEAHDVYLVPKPVQSQEGSSNSGVFGGPNLAVEERHEPAKQQRDDAGAAGQVEDAADVLAHTHTSVKYDEETQTAVITLIATVRSSRNGPSGVVPMEASSSNSNSCSSSSSSCATSPDAVAGSHSMTVSLAAQAMARACSQLEDKVFLSAPKDMSATMAASAARARTAVRPSFLLQQREEIHADVLLSLELNRVVDMQLLPAEEGWGTCFRPWYKVQLCHGQHEEKILEAIMKPMCPGDSFIRWRAAPPDWVAYKLSGLLGMDMVPPAVVLRDTSLPRQQQGMAALVLHVPSVRLLSELPCQDWGCACPETVLGDAHVLDALMGSAERGVHAFKAGQHWSHGWQLRPVLLSHPCGPEGGTSLPLVWTRRGPQAAMEARAFVPSPTTMLCLRRLTRADLQFAMGDSLSPSEQMLILEKRDQLLAYFDAASMRLAAMDDY